MKRMALFQKTLSLGLLFVLCVGVGQVVAAGQANATPISPSLAGWQTIKEWNFDVSQDLEDWTRRDESDSDGGEYLWAESPVTYTTGTQSVGAWSKVVTGTVIPPDTAIPPTTYLPYPDNLDTWLIYSFTAPISDVWGVRLVFDWWLNAMPGDTFSWLTSTDGREFTPVETKSEQLGEWHVGEVRLHRDELGDSTSYIAFRFQSNDDDLAGLGVFVDQVRLQYNFGHEMYLPLTLKNWPPLPATPHLLEIDKAPLDNAYLLSWHNATSDPPEIYTLQESTAPDFSSPTHYTTPITSYQVAGKGIGIYHYRVRATNTWGSSHWSNAVSTTVLSLHDDFDNPITGWTARRTSSPDLDLASTTYEAGKLVTGLHDRFDFAVFSPMFEAPSPPYVIRMQTRIGHLANEVSYGIVFGGNGGTACPIDRSQSGDSDGCFYHYYRLNVIWGGYLKCQVKRIDSHDPNKGGGRGEELMAYRDVSDRVDDDRFNIWEIRVYDHGFDIYVNGRFLEDFDDRTYIYDPYYGIFTSTYEYNSATFEHEYFYVDPMSAVSMLPATRYSPPVQVNWEQPLIEIEPIAQMK
jgi:hypothetical protein